MHMGLLRHLTLNTGHERLSPRAEVPDWAIDRLRPLIDAGGGAIGIPGWRLDITHRMDGAAVWQIGPESRLHEPWVICATCWDLAISGQAWSNIMALGKALGLPGVASPITDVPWLVAAITPGVNALPLADIMALGDAERCIAWALIVTATAP